MRGYSLLILYLRISVEDMDHNGEDKDESNSIVNQRELLRRYVEDTPELSRYQVMELCDDGYSGTNMERPGMEKLLDMAKKGQVGCILVKDFSRFGRDYLTVSDYVDQIFPFIGIRFISINDNYDSAKCNGATSGVEIVFRNVIYGYYSQDLSVKVRNGKRTKAQSGKFMSPFAPIGYQKAPENRNQLVVEPEGAAIVRRIFRMAGEGMSVMQILRVLNRERIPTPSQLKNRHGEFHKWWVGVGDNKVWDGSIVVNILRDERYLGKNVYGKHYRPVVGDYRTKKSSRETFKSRQADLSHRQEEAQEDQERMEEELAKLEHLVSSGQMEEQTLENYLGMEELTREMVEAFIDCIYVYDDKSIHIQWRFENGIEE